MARASVTVTLEDGRRGEAGFCRSCNGAVVWILSESTGKISPWNRDGVSHFATCPQAGSWRRERDGWLVPAQRHACAMPGCGAQANGGKVFCLPHWTGVPAEVQRRLTGLLAEASAAGKSPSAELRGRWRSALELAVGSLMAHRAALAGESA